jgi:regulatory protein
MPTITKILEQKRRANRRNVHLDGAFAFGCNVNVVARFRLRVGMQLTEEHLQEIQKGEVRQECFDAAIGFLKHRLHSRAELRKKLMRREYGPAIIDDVLNDLSRLGYLDDDRFARTKAIASSQHKRHGPRRAMVELLKAGVKSDVAQRALADVYQATDPSENARLLAQRQAPRLRKLDPLVARRRLVGMLQRRGFDYDTIKPIVDQVLGEEQHEK